LNNNKSGQVCAILCVHIDIYFRLLDVVSAQRTHHDLQLMLIFEHVDQDLAQYLEKHSAGLGLECIQVVRGLSVLYCLPVFTLFDTK